MSVCREGFHEGEAAWVSRPFATSAAFFRTLEYPALCYDSRVTEPIRTVSIVIPCLNEEATVAQVVQDAQASFKGSPYALEILVLDNGSTDQSARRASEAGAQVIAVPDRGYGAAIRAGFLRATGDAVLMGDADGTYDFRSARALVDCLAQSDAQMAIGSRITGQIEQGAMSRLHRYLGTPVLTRLINLLFQGHITDCNSGFRVFRRSRLALWRPTAPGMEFASEMIVNCLRSGDRIVEMPIPFRQASKNRKSHLSTWRDGMRHLLFILSRAPHGFTYFGVATVITSLAMALPSILLGPAKVGPFSVFDFHTLIFGTLVGFIGTQSMGYGLILDSESGRPLSLNLKLLGISEIFLVNLMAGLLMSFVCFLGYLVMVWIRHGFENLHYLRASLTLLYLNVVPGSLGFSIFVAKVHQRRQQP